MIEYRHKKYQKKKTKKQILKTYNLNYLLNGIMIIRKIRESKM